MSKAELARRLGVDRGTVHRWETSQSRPEQADIVMSFADLFGLDLDEALAAAGMRPQATAAPAPVREPPLDPDLRLIARRLADPSVSEAEKATIRATLQYLANLPVPPRRGRRGA